MRITKKNISKKVSRSLKKNEKDPGVTIVYKSKTSKSSFPEKTDRVNKLLSKAKLLK
jgi:hypothetical protein